MLPKKNSRAIEVGDESYRWAVSGDSGFNVLVVQHAAANGQRVEVIASTPDEGGPASITPALVAQAVREAMQIGWKPKDRASPLVLTLNQKQQLEIRRGLGPA